MSKLKTSLRIAPISFRVGSAWLAKRHPLGAGHHWLLTLGVFWNNKLEGVATIGHPITNNAVQKLGLYQRQALELRKLFLTDALPKLSESRVLAIVARLIRKQYPRIEMLLTYCESNERATAYKAAGWIKDKSNHYLREVVINNRVLSVRDVNRRGGLKQIDAKFERRYVDRTKWILPLTQNVRDRCAGSDTKDTPACPAGEGGSTPTPALQSSKKKSTVNNPSLPNIGTGAGSAITSESSQQNGPSCQNVGAGTVER